MRRSMHSSKSFEFHRKLGVDIHKNIFKLIGHLNKRKKIKEVIFIFR